MSEKAYIAIDLKSFYASAECAERGLDPLNTNLVVADSSRTDKTICLAVSPSLKALGVPGRPRLFEVVSSVKEINALRRSLAPKGCFTGSSYIASELAGNPSLKLDYIVAPPRMSLYMQYSTRIYGIYLRFIAPEDIHVYSVDEVFIDATGYLKTYGLTPRQLAVKLIKEVLRETGITATAGIGTNLYLCKVAMDIVAKHAEPDSDGVRIASLDEKSYREILWNHRPLTDFWRIGRGIEKKLADHGMLTMGDVARCSLGGPGDIHSEELLYRLFGVNAELLIDHAWGWESCSIADIKKYRPKSKSVSQGQVLSHPYSFSEGLIITKEMADMLALDLVSRGLVSDQLVLTLGYETEDTNALISEARSYGKSSDEPEHMKRGYYDSFCSRGSIGLGLFTSAASVMVEAASELYLEICNPRLRIRRIYIVADHALSENEIEVAPKEEQLSMFSGEFIEGISEGSPGSREAAAAEEDLLEKEKKVQQTMLSIKNRFGKNALVRGMNLQDGATGLDSNRQIGGHRA